DVSKQGKIIADMDTDVDVTLKDVVAVAKYVQEAEMEESADVQGRQAKSHAQIYQIDLEHTVKWKFLIHTILQCMSAKRTSGNEFSFPMASVVICLSTFRKFNFSKYIFDSLVRNVESSTKFYMYSHFLQLIIRARVGDLSLHTTKYSSPALTQKVFANIRRIGKGCSGVETTLFEGMIVEQQVGEGADEVHVEDVFTAGVATEGATSVADDEFPTVVDNPSIASPPPPTQPPPPSQDIPSTSQVQLTPPQSPQAQPQSPQHQPQPSQDAGISMDLLQNLLDTCITLTRRVEHLE
nr:hypothetical protein [Tanacetum cinerariifolium]